MEIVELTPEKYKEWDEFCLFSDDAWLWHTSSWLEYTLNYKPELKPESKSFMILQNKQIIAICPLILETYEEIKEFSFGGGFGPIPALANFLASREKRKIEKLIFREIDRLAKEYKVKRTRLRFPVLNKSFIETFEQKCNFLLKFGYLDNSIHTQVIDLSKSIEVLRKEIRHGHDYDIDKASRILKVEIFDQNSVTKEIFDQYRNLHHKAVGRITRPKVTFDIMYNLIKDDKAFLVGAKKENSFVGFSYFLLFKNNVYWGSSADDPDLKNFPISHFIQWKAIEWMKKKGHRFYEIGWQKYANTLYDFPSPKEINISKFKRGFGGFTVPLFQGEKYYDKDYFLKVYQERIKKFADNL